MLTKVALKVSLFAAFITFVFCVVTDISMARSFSRAAVVFVGFYLILVAFFIALRFIFGRLNRAEEVPFEIPGEEKETEKEKKEELAEADAVGVEGE